MCILLLVNNSETLSYTHSHREIVLLSKQGIFIDVHLFNLNLLKDNHLTTMRHKLKHLVFVFSPLLYVSVRVHAHLSEGGRGAIVWRISRAVFIEKSFVSPVSSCGHYLACDMSYLTFLVIILFLMLTRCQVPTNNQPCLTCSSCPRWKPYRETQRSQSSHRQTSLPHNQPHRHSSNEHR